MKKEEERERRQLQRKVIKLLVAIEEGKLDWVTVLGGRDRDPKLALTRYLEMWRYVSVKAYNEPPEPCFPVTSYSHEERVVELAMRRRAGYGLWHKKDWVNQTGQESLQRALLHATVQGVGGCGHVAVKQGRTRLEEDRPVPVEPQRGTDEAWARWWCGPANMPMPEESPPSMYAVRQAMDQIRGKEDDECDDDERDPDCC